MVELVSKKVFNEPRLWRRAARRPPAGHVHRRLRKPSVHQTASWSLACRRCFQECTSDSGMCHEFASAALAARVVLDDGKPHPIPITATHAISNTLPESSFVVISKTKARRSAVRKRHDATRSGC